MQSPWWRHQMETFSALLAICAGNSPVPGEFPTQRPVTRSFDVFFDLRLNKWLSKLWWGWWFETLSRPLWRHRNATQLHSLSPEKNEMPTSSSLTGTVGRHNDTLWYHHWMVTKLASWQLSVFIESLNWFKLSYHIHIWGRWCQKQVYLRQG